METSNNWFLKDPQRTLQNLYDQHFPWLLQYIKKNNGDRADAEDIFQEGLMAAWINLKAGRFEGPEEKFGAYIKQICKYKWLSHLRSAGFKQLQHTPDMAVFEQMEQIGADQQLQLAQAKLLSESLAALGQKCKKLLQLFYYQRKSLSEIAALEGNSQESIKTIKYRCMMQLRKIYLEKHIKNGEV